MRSLRSANFVNSVCILIYITLGPSAENVLCLRVDFCILFGLPISIVEVYFVRRIIEGACVYFLYLTFFFFTSPQSVPFSLSCASCILLYYGVVSDMGATRPALPSNPLSARGGEKARFSHFQSAIPSGAFWLCFSFLSSDSQPSPPPSSLLL